MRNHSICPRSFTRLLLVLGLLAAALARPLDPPQPLSAAVPARTPQEPAAPSLALVVDRDNDTNTTACTAADNDCSLRGAINRINAEGGSGHTITFSPSITQVVVVSPLPIITTTMGIFGNDVPTRINAAFMSNGSVLTVNANNVVISRLAIINGKGGAADSYADIRVEGGQGARILDNYLGTLPGASTCTPPGVPQASSYGILVTGAAGAAGGTNGTYIYGNTIGCHDRDGILLHGADSAYIGQSAGGAAIRNYIGLNLSGTALPNGGDGIRLQGAGSDGAHDNLIRGNTIGSNAGYGIAIAGTGLLDDEGTYGNRVIGNSIGLTTGGTTRANGAGGLSLSNGAFANRIGGTAGSDRNVISGNAGPGVSISGSSPSNGVLGNYIGTDAAGSASRPNSTHGVFVSSGTFSTIGGYRFLFFEEYAPNVISGNGQNGVRVTGSAAAGTLVTGNRIGTNAAGTAALANGSSGVFLGTVTGGGVITGNVISGNGSHGIELVNTPNFSITANIIGLNAAGTAAVPNVVGVAIIGASSTGNRVGGLTGNTRNVISGNSNCGVNLLEAHNNLVAYNFIGLNAAGLAAIPNSAGICLSFANNNQIGAASAVASQFVSGNTGTGIYVQGGTGNQIRTSTLIGVAANGTTPRGNGGHGILIDGGTNTSALPGVASHNGGAGIAVVGAGATGNYLAPRSTRDNGGLPTDLGNNGHTPNDPGDADSGPNTLLNYPEITASAGSVISGTACANCTVLVYLAHLNPAAPGGGGEYHTSVLAGAGGGWSVDLGPEHTAGAVALVAIDAADNSSEMSPREVVLKLYLPLTRR
jgi:hypothetical protein